MSYIGFKPVQGNVIVDEFTSSGGSTYTLSSQPTNNNVVEVVVGGLTQSSSAYSFSGTTLTLAGVASGTKIIVRQHGEKLLIPTPGDDTVTGAKIVDNALDSEHYADGSIDTAHIADGAITAAKIADGTVVAAEIASNAVTTAKILDANVTTAKIAADAIDGTKLADNACNSEHYTDGSIDLAHLSSQSVDEDNLYISNAGTNGQFLQKQSGNSGGLTWADAGVSGITDNSNAVAITIDSSERVGINETSPAEYLHISGNNPTIRIDAAGHPNDGKILFTDNGSATERAQIYYDCEGAGTLCIENMNDSADADISIGVRRNGSYREAIRIEGDGVIKKTWTPYYLAWGGSQANVTGTGNTVNVTMTGRIDQGSNVSNNTFTAPQTGRYLICSSVHIENVATNASAVGHNIITSNRTYGSFNNDTQGDLKDYWTVSNAVVADMDAGDTAYLQCRVASMSSNTADLGSGAGYHFWSVTMVA